MSNNLVTLNLVVYNGEKYVRQCLDSVLAQSYPRELIEINVLDNNSMDGTRGVLKNQGETKFNFVESKLNLGMWPGQELLLENSHGKYVVVLSVDVVLHPDFVKNTVEAMEHDEKIGALQGKIYKYEFPYIQGKKYEILDTLGFKIFRSRRIVNIGHGEEDVGQYNLSPNPQFETRALNKLSARPSTYRVSAPVFAVEGAAPVFRRQALEDCRLKSQDGKIVEPDFFWYGDDLDLAWRMRMFGWKQVYVPSVIALHDRKTTKGLAGGWRKFIKMRRVVPMFKRRLDWRNTTLTIIKNDFASNFLRDLPYILWRQARLWAYFIIYEPSMLIEIFNVAKLLPKMLKRRREIMQKAKISPKDFRQWIL